MNRLLLDYLVRYRWRWAAGVLLTMCSTGFGLVTPWLLRQAIDSFSGGPPSLAWPLAWYAGAIVALAVVEGISRFFSRYILTGASRWVEYDLRNRYFAHLETLEPAFFQQHRTGDLVARATNDLSAVRQLFGPAAYTVMSTGFLVVTALILMFQLSPSLAVWAALVTPAAIAVFVITRTRIEQRFTRVQEQFAAMADHAQETFAGERVVKAYAQEHAEIENFRSTSREYVKRQISQILLSGLMWPTMTLVVGLLIVFLLYAGGSQVVDGRLTLGEFVQFNAYVGMMAWPMMALGWVASMWQQGAASLKRIHEVLAVRPTITDGHGPRLRNRHARAELQFRDVSLEIDGQHILRDINLTIPAGSTYAIVGPLGSGKSSLVHLIARLTDPTAGQILLDGEDIRSLGLAELRQQIGFVPQETFLFSGSLRENVAFGIAPDQATESRIRAAVHLSRLENDLDQWPNGLDTRIGERGVTLSGGQKQRTAIARAVAKDPAILVLDDALSSVDTRTEEAVLESLHEFVARRTSIIIAHRLSTTRSADQVVVLDRGRIVEQGTHAALVARGGLYTRIYRRQLIAEEMDLEDEA